MHLEPASPKSEIGASLKSKVRKDFEQYFKWRRQRLACVDEDKMATAGMNTQVVQPVDEERPKAWSPRSDPSDSASAASSDVAAGLYFLSASLRPESDGDSEDVRPTSAATCPAFRLESDAGYESVGSSAEAV